MLHNLVLRRLRYALDLREGSMQQIFARGGTELAHDEITNLLRRDDDPLLVMCSDELLAAFLDGLILDYRGPKDGDAPNSAPRAPERLSNNLILKKIRIALELREEAMLDIMKRANFVMSKGELSAISRNPGARNYKPCGDQFLRNFLIGLCSYKNRRAPEESEDTGPR